MFAFHILLRPGTGIRVPFPSFGSLMPSDSDVTRGRFYICSRICRE
jgi:hypothetical protein